MRLLDQQELQNPDRIVDFILDTVEKFQAEASTLTRTFRLTRDEKDLLSLIGRRVYTGEPTAVSDLHELRILYWQVVGFHR